MEITGTITVLKDTEEFGSKGFRKRELVLTTQEKYPQPILVEFVQDNCDLPDPYQIGQDVTISINLRGREWTSPQGEVRYFNSVQGWKISAVEATQEAPQTAMDEQEDDIPF